LENPSRRFTADSRNDGNFREKENVMKLPLEYQILSRVCPHDNYSHPSAESKFEEAVNKAIADGWEPLGGLCAVGHPKTTVLYQAMIRKQKPIMDSN
jgi:Domain of unknown function (DUF1737)